MGILYSEDPSFFSPVIREIIRLRPNSVAAVFPAGNRGAGPRAKGPLKAFSRMLTLWLIWETPGFVLELLHRGGAMAAGGLGRASFPLAGWSVSQYARRTGISVVPCVDPNGEAFIATLRELQIDILLNQTDRLLKAPVLATPRLGVVNRHGSLLPSFRGRMASFWSHGAEPPVHGLTFHLVDEDLDTGPIILQKSLNIDPCATYPEVLANHRHASPPLFWEAVDRIASPGFQPFPNHHQGTRTYRFPTLEDAWAYRRTLMHRRLPPCP